MKGVRYHGPTPPYKGSWVLNPENPNMNAMYVDRWRIECARLYHKHTTKGGMEVECDVNERVCWMCGAICSDSIWFAHRLQQI